MEGGNPESSAPEAPKSPQDDEGPVDLLSGFSQLDTTQTDPKDDSASSSSSSSSSSSIALPQDTESKKEETGEETGDKDVEAEAVGLDEKNKKNSWSSKVPSKDTNSKTRVKSLMIRDSLQFSSSVGSPHPPSSSATLSTSSTSSSSPEDHFDVEPQAKARSSSSIVMPNYKRFSLQPSLDTTTAQFMEDSRSSFNGGTLFAVDEYREEWEALITKWPRPQAVTQIGKLLKSRAGMHPASRSRLWSFMIFDLISPNTPTTRVFQRMLEAKADEDVVYQIEKDLNRTAPSEEYKHLLTEERQEALGRVLRAFATYDPNVGYCQGMNFLGFMFLIHLDEEDSFWGLVALLHGLNLRGVYMRQEALLFALLETIFAENAHHFPDLASHLDREGIQPTMFAMDWLTTLFVYSLSFEAAERVWDIFLFEGTKGAIQWLFQVSVAVFKITKDALLSWSLEDIMQRFKAMVMAIPAKQLLSTALGIDLSAQCLQQISRVCQQNPSCIIQ